MATLRTGTLPAPAGLPLLIARQPAETAVSGWGGRAGSLLADGASLLALVWGLPLAVLLVGTPIALVIVLLLWLGRMVLGAF